MTTGRTPTLSARIAAGSVALLIDFRQGQLLAQVGQTAAAAVTGTTGGLNRAGWFNTLVSGGNYLSLASAITLGKTYTIMISATPTSLTGSAFLGRASDSNDCLQLSSVTVGDLYHVISGNGRASSIGMFAVGRRNVGSLVRNGTASVSFYKDGVFLNTPADHNNNNDYGTIDRIFKRGVSGMAFAGNVNWILITTTAESAANQLLLIDELDNQISYETDLFTINKDYPTVGSSVWEARYGILAGEVTMSAGQPLGQFAPFKVSTGTHKMTTFLYGTQLAKGVQCVTAGNIILPDPRPSSGTQFQYKYYTAATTTWSDATAATTTVNLAAAGDRILWSTYDGKTCLKKV